MRKLWGLAVCAKNNVVASHLTLERQAVFNPPDAG